MVTDVIAESNIFILLRFGNVMEFSAKIFALVQEIFPNFFQQSFYQS